MNRHVKIGLALLIPLGCLPSDAEAQAPGGDSSMKRLTPVIFVSEIEPCIQFWTETLGFEKTMEVPTEEGGGLAFAAFQKGSAEVMYQTLDALEEDIPSLAEVAGSAPTFLFVEVTSVEELDRLDEALTAAGAPRVLPRRKTFYGADEVVVRDPCGTVVTLAAFGEGDAQG